MKINNYSGLIITLTLLFCVFQSAKSQDSNSMLTRYESSPYENLYDSISDVGQYWIPNNKVKPTMVWEWTDLNNSKKNSLGETNIASGLQFYLTAQSVIGLTFRALKEGRTNVGVWMRVASESYERTLGSIVRNGATYLGAKTGIQLLTEDLTPDTQLKKLFSGYVLTDVEKNPESNIVAAVASHVYNAIIVDVRDSAVYNQYGYKMLYNATTKTTANAWSEFKNKCSNKGLVLMAVQTGGLREFAIANNFFVINLNKEYQSKLRENLALFKQILAWLEPGSPVFGWEFCNGENVFAEPISDSGNVFIPYSDAFNSSMSSMDYVNKQNSPLTNVIDPRNIDYTKPGKFVSFFLTDGDNVPWMMNNFESLYVRQPSSKTVKMGYTFSTSNLSMLHPTQFNYLQSQFTNENTLIEFGGGYTYYDRYGDLTGNRNALLVERAKKVAAHMRQRRVKVLGMFLSLDATSAKAQEAYRIMIENNDQLEGIVTVQYSPYNGGRGNIMWFKNSKNIYIPVITTRYSLWNFGTYNSGGQGTPRYVANSINASNISSPFSNVCVHAWSKFSDTNTTSLLDQNDNGTIMGAGAAQLCKNDLASDVNNVSVQELIWRVRMYYQPAETQAYLNSLNSTDINTPNSADNINLYTDKQSKSVIFSTPLSGSVSMYDINGKLLRNCRMAGEKNFSYGNITKGMYILSITTNEKKINKKIFID